MGNQDIGKLVKKKENKPVMKINIRSDPSEEKLITDVNNTFDFNCMEDVDNGFKTAAALT